MDPRSKNEPATLFACLKRVLRALFENALFFFVSSLLFLGVLLILFRMFIQGHVKAAALLSLPVIPFASAGLCSLAAGRIGYPSSLSPGKAFLRLFLFIVVSYFFTGLFFFNTAFYSASVSSKGATVTNSFFLFFSLSLVFMAVGSALIGIPLCFREGRLLNIFKSAPVLFFVHLRRSAAATFLFIILGALSFVFFGLFFAPVVSLCALLLAGSIDAEILPLEGMD